MHRWPWLVVAGVTILALGAAGAWAALAVLRPTDDPLASTEHTYVEVTAGSVGTSIALNTVAAWSQVPVAANQATGIVTEMTVETGAEVAQGATLYTVGLRPVVAAQGEVPMFRDIGAEATGADVSQLQQMLASLGLYGGAIDGKAGRGTVTAITSWQGSLGVDKTGVVALGDVVFLPQLPSRVAFDPELIARGLTLSGGESAILGLAPAPAFWIPVTDAQAAMIPAGGSVEVTAPDGQVWPGVAGEQKRNADDGTVTIAVAGAEGAVLCGDSCGQVPISGQATLPSKIVTVEQVDGLVVPSAALVTTATNDTAVIDSDDNRVPVEVVASAKGMSVITGAPEGLRVRVPATEESG
ncbi:peptidoglycan-binding protein [Microbacterium sp. NPDC087589]|uniref:peptidoglycan-binding protein n=1 Tax=Microbacterium sp. NPDC087589 TaxID=3364191 RepID=UPI003811D318